MYGGHIIDCAVPCRPLIFISKFEFCISLRTPGHSIQYARNVPQKYKVSNVSVHRLTSRCIHIDSYRFVRIKLESLLWHLNDRVVGRRFFFRNAHGGGRRTKFSQHINWLPLNMNASKNTMRKNQSNFGMFEIPKTTLDFVLSLSVSEHRQRNLTRFTSQMLAFFIPKFFFLVSFSLWHLVWLQILLLASISRHRATRTFQIFQNTK